MLDLTCTVRQAPLVGSQMTMPPDAGTGGGSLGERPLILLVASRQCAAFYKYGWPEEADSCLESIVAT